MLLIKSDRLLGRQFTERAESSVAERLHGAPKPERPEKCVQTLEFRVPFDGEGSVERRGIQVRLLGYLRNAAKRLGHAPERGACGGSTYQKRPSEVAHPGIRSGRRRLNSFRTTS
jgi:hypothetical protein